MKSQQIRARNPRGPTEVLASTPPPTPRTPNLYRWAHRHYHYRLLLILQHRLRQLLIYHLQHCQRYLLSQIHRWH